MQMLLTRPARRLTLALLLLAAACESSSRGELAPDASPAGGAPQPSDVSPAQESPAPESSQTRMPETDRIALHVFNEQGELVGPLPMAPVRRTDEEWRALLTPEQHRIARNAGTERAFCGTLLDNKLEGVYTCIGCGLPLFSSSSKFHSGTGWPSFFQPIAKANVAEKVDRSHGMLRTEIECARCECHLGHVFEDGPPPTGLRYCLNSESLSFTPIDQLKSLADPRAQGVRASAEGTAAATAPATATVVFGGGCFWCVEAVFEELDGVIEAISGYAGGSAESANYEAVCTGRTGHAEAVEIRYDPSRIGYVDLLQVHLATHDPTSLNRQGADVGTQYRSVIFYTTEEERQLAQALLDDMRDARIYSKPIVTTLEPLKAFYPAEAYHQNFVCRNPQQGYVRAVALPKVEKVREKFRERLKAVSPLEEGR